MTVEVNGIYLTALEKIAEEYNKKTLEIWDQGRLSLRQKQTAETILKEVILSYFHIKYPKIYDEVLEELNAKIEELSKRDGLSGEHYEEFSRFSNAKIDMLGLLAKEND